MVIQELKGAGRNVSEDQHIRAMVSRLFWSWFLQHQDDTLIKRRILGFISITIKVSDIRFLFETLFGPQPESVL